MTLKRIYEEYGFNIESLLIKEHRRLGLKTEELNVLLVLFSNRSKKKVFSINSLSRRTDYSQNQLADIINALLEKDFIELNLETTEKRSRELYSLDKTFIKINEMYLEEEKELLIENSKTHVAETISLLEQRLNRMLRPDELSRVRVWYEDYNFLHHNIISAINSVKQNLNLIYVEKLLTMDIEKPKKLDERTEQLLDEIYKKL